MKVVHGRHVYRKYIGVAQGGAMSPLLANIFLDSFDKYLHELGALFVRYADDVVLFCREQKEAELLLNVCRNYMEDKLELQLNKEKTRIVCPEELCYLGYSFKKADELYCFSLGEKTKQKMGDSMMKVTASKGKTPEERLDRTGEFNRGWINYFKLINHYDMQAFLTDMDKQQFALIHDKVAVNLCDNNKDKFIGALYSSKSFVTLSEWYSELAGRDIYGL